MKEIMYNVSSDIEDGVASFSYIPTKLKQLEILFDYSRPIDKLGEDLLNQFSGSTETVESIFYKHHVGKPFILKNYKDALKRLEEAGKIFIDPPANRRRVIKGIVSLKDEALVTFP